MQGLNYHIRVRMSVRNITGNTALQAFVSRHPRLDILTRADVAPIEPKRSPTGCLQVPQR